jgi:uncharacterized protein DUF6882
MNAPGDDIECAEHGRRDATYVCQHLVSGTDSGFHCGHNDADPDRLWPDAWCDACEDVRASEDGWNDRSEAFAGIQLLCDGCYQRARERNWKQDDAAFGRLMSEAVDDLKERQAQLYAQFKLDDYPRWDWNQEASQLVFSEGGLARVVAGIQFVGSVSTLSGTWRWSWANPSILECAKRRIREVRAYGVERHYLKLASASWVAEEVDGWEMTAIAARLIGAAGAYRTPADDGWSFLAITEARWAR